MSTPVLGRNARLLKGGVAIGYGKNISVKASAELIKEYSMDSLTPAVTGAGKQILHMDYGEVVYRRHLHCGCFWLAPSLTWFLLLKAHQLTGTKRLGLTARF